MGWAAPQMNRPSVVGAGSWGTAIALVLARRGLPVRLWVHNPDLAERISKTRMNEAYLPGFPLCDSIEICTNMHNCVQGADTVTFAVPSHALRQVAVSARGGLSPETLLISATKGLEEGTLSRMSEVLKESAGSDRIVVLSGPSFAREVAQEQPTAIVVASRDLRLALEVQNLFSAARFRVYASQDVMGVEVGGAVKNVIAIAAGVCHGLDLGQNAIAALITRGLAEMSRLAAAMGAQPQTLSGLAGLGDLVLTCTGELSRNRQVGIQLAAGQTLQQILHGMKTVAEGIKTTSSVVQLGIREHVDLPISQQMHAVLHGERSAPDAIAILMERSLRGE